jgi:hypothetical protein
MAYLEKTKLSDDKGEVVNPASDESNALLRRIVKLLESQAATDSAQRQRVTIDAGTLPTVTTVGTVAAVTTVAGVTTVASVTNLAALNGWNQQMFADPARHAYNSGIRSALTFS